VAGPRAVRIPRSTAPHAVRVATEAPPRPRSAAPGRRENVAGNQRAVRTTLVFLLALALLYLAFVVYGRSSPGGRTPGAEEALLLFAGFAAAIGVAGAVLALTPAPRAVEVSEDRLVVIGRWGRRTEWPPIPQVTRRVVRRYPGGFLSSGNVESVEVWASGRRPRTYLVEEGLFDEPIRSS
jgi:hypothetical protein